MGFILSPAALLDIRAISEYTLKTWGEEQERIYLESIWQQMEIIKSNPFAMRIRTDLPSNCRSARVGKHVIFFKVNCDSIEIVRVLHAAMDFRTQLSLE